MDMDFSIKTDDGQILVSPFDEKVWFTLYNRMGSARAILSREQAKQIVDSLQSILGTTEIAE